MSDVAKTIFKQLGGSRFVLLTSAKEFVHTDRSLQCKIGRNPKKITHVKITLEGDDTYTVEFMKWNGRAVTMNTVEKQRGVYVDMLPDIFHSGTGLYITWR